MNIKFASQTHMNTYKKSDQIFTHGKGTWLYDSDGNKYLDFVSGIAVNSLGHCHNALIDVIKVQSEKLFHISNLYWNLPQLELSQRLIKNSQHKEVFFCNSGTEAVEAALKLAKKYGKQFSPTKNKIVYLENAFHGRSMGALSVTYNPKYKNIATPLLPETYTLKVEDFEALDNIMTDDTCCVIVEPIQGEGGINPISKEFLKAIENKCKEKNALLIFDEIQAGIGRTGHFFAYEFTEVVPDVVCLAKGLGGGFPIGAILANEKAAIFEPGDHGSTFGGNPLACSVAAKVVEIIDDQNFLESVKSNGQYLKSILMAIQETTPQILKVKGEGLLMGIEIPDHKDALINALYKKNVLVISAGTDTIRILPPLNVTTDEIDFFIIQLKSALSQILTS